MAAFFVSCVFVGSLPFDIFVFAIIISPIQKPTGTRRVGCVHFATPGIKQGRTEIAGGAKRARTRDTFTLRKP